MARTPKDTFSPRPDGAPEVSLERLEQALAAEVETSTTLRDNLDALRDKVDQIEASFSKRIEEASQRHTVAESTISDQQQRLSALGNGREESMRLLAEARAEIARVSAERDDLRRQLSRIDGMQTATVTLDHEEIEEPSIHASLPSIEELMASLGSFEEKLPQHFTSSSSSSSKSPLLSPVVGDDEESQQLIAPELVFPDEFAEEDVKMRASPPPRVSRVLVLLDDMHPIKYPLYKSVMTIGRSEQADIQVQSDFISRVHARVVSNDDCVVVEDVASKNGIRVNSEQTSRHELKHGDVIALGKTRFTFIDSDTKKA